MINYPQDGSAFYVNAEDVELFESRKVVDQVKKINEIDHNAVRGILNYLKIKQGLEIHYDGDLPARSGMGSSSCFVVGLLKALYKIKNINISKSELSKKSIYIEQKILKEKIQHVLFIHQVLEGNLKE